MQFAITERDGSGRLQVAYCSSNAEGGGHDVKGNVEIIQLENEVNSVTDWRHFLAEVFLPDGYPSSVSNDYLQYQIYNALQAFCSSLTGLLASRAVLEGHGVGNASASATNAVFLTVVQDIFSRLITIVAGYRLGTYLSPEAKTFRLLADLFNDAAIILDVLSPLFSTLVLSWSFPFLQHSEEPSSFVRVAALCLSGAFRALCGVVAGGSKAALAIHFANDGKVPGDIGDLNAKDGSKETVLGLLGMLGGTLVMHYVHDHMTVYVLFTVLVTLHLLTNYAAVRVVAMRTLNRQRANLAWMASRPLLEHFSDQPTAGGQTSNVVSSFPSPELVSRWERIFADPSAVYAYSDNGTRTSRLLGHCIIGSAFSTILLCQYRGVTGLGSSCPAQCLPRSIPSSGEVEAILDVFKEEEYVLWFDACSRHVGRVPYLHVCLKENHTPLGHLRGWCHAQELALRLQGLTPSSLGARLEAVRVSHDELVARFPAFRKAALALGWRGDESSLLAGSARTFGIKVGQAASLEDGVHQPEESRKRV